MVVAILDPDPTTKRERQAKVEPESDNPQWEYRIVTSGDGLYISVESAPGAGEAANVLLDDYMTRIGALGWELVTAYRTDLGHNFVFKRRFPTPSGELARTQ